MAKFKIVTGARAGGKAGYGFEMEALSRLDAEIVEIPIGSEDEMLQGARDADAIYAFAGGKAMPITRRVIEGLERCKLIALPSVGTDTVDVVAATERGIPVTNVPDTFIDEVADHCMTLLLGGYRRLVVQDRMARDGRWREGRPMLYEFPRLRGMTLGFISFGRVARGVAERAKPFGFRMMGYDPYIDELVMSPYDVQAATLEEVLEQSDIVSMHTPGTPETGHLLGAREFGMMKRGAIFVNTGRGATVDEAALIAALNSGQVAVAALDVLEREPPDLANPLLKMDQVILTAHVASASSRFDPARKRRVGQELALVAQGRWPLSCVNPAALERSSLKRWQPIPMLRGPNS